MSAGFFVLTVLYGAMCFVGGYAVGLLRARRIVEEEFNRAKGECYRRIDDAAHKLRVELRVVKPYPPELRQ